MPRQIWITGEPYPTTDAVRADAAAVGATEIVHGITPALAALGITTLGFHTIPDPPESPDSRAELLARLDDAVLLDEIRAVVADAINGGVI